MSRSKLQKLLNKLDGTSERTATAIRDFEGGVQTLREKLQQEISASTLEEVNLKINKLRKSIDLEPIITGLNNLEQNFKENVLSLTKSLEQKTAELEKLTLIGDEQLVSRATTLTSEIASIKSDLDNMVTNNRTELNLINNELTNLLEASKGLVTKVELVGTVKEIKESATKVDKKQDEDIKEVEEDVKKLRRELTDRINNKGGGNANRDIRVNGNSVLGKYTDFNLQNSSTIGWTTRINETLKRVDFFASVLTGGGSGTPGGADKQIQYNNNGAFGGDPALLWSSSVLAVGQPGSVRGAIDLAGATAQTVRVQVPSTAGAWVLTLPANDGGAGQYLLTDGNGITQWASVTAAGGSGITRTVSVISVSSTLAAAASTDYVLLPNVGIQVTLPTAISNSNLYTVKNNSTSSILVVAPTGQTIDGSANALMPTENESLSFISNSSVWSVV